MRDYHVKYERKLNMDTIAALLCFLFLVLFTAVAAIWAVPGTLAAEVTMEVYQQSDGKAFGKTTSLDIFNNEKLGGEKVIDPFSSGTYTFAVSNSAASSLLPYSLLIEAANEKDIPLVFNIRKNGEYIFGVAGDSGMLPLDSVNLDDLQLQGNTADIYTLNWRWKTESDSADTELGVRAETGEELIYSLKITAIGTISEEDISNNGKGADGTLGKIIGGLPKTGDNTSILMWIIILCISLLLIFGLLFYKRRKKKEADEKIHKDS